MPHQDTRILLLEGVHQNAVTTLKQAGFARVELLSGALEGNALADTLQRADVVGIRSRTQLSDAVLQTAPHLQAIGCFCIGTNQVALERAQALGIPVFNAPYSNTRSVAELVIAEIICLLRGLMRRNQAVHEGRWPKDAHGACEARGKTLGIIGYGNIGAQLSILAENLGMRVIFYDIQSRLPLGNAEAAPSLDALLAQADIVSLHVPESPATRELISARELYQMKKGAMLVNAARGQCVAIDDLCEALQSGHIAGAALDVFPQEPKSADEALESPLRGMENVILTPHIGGSTIEAQANIGLEVAGRFIQYLKNGTTIGAVNFPEVSLPLRDNTHRLLHIHENRPGVLSAVNRLFAEHNINIAAQTLSTKDSVGYLVMDVARSDSEVALEQLQGVDGTIRSRRIY
ncbi:phosphoglycerate dehydrogenase [Cardiobacterium valvarum]|uniref:D-3-phosphoglycerate dehydrogenase n=1 Tax=Cardiobacterium valvarum F0432 TaxID=797473 RepID=G9ZBY2_9GAMM|nr:phosphoglycerate dehydrogenase [Cardiobacterium valvarum]EHM55958.1 phosphoglycerate dehydrogenase [Cardiobacterium valvarum F0432]